MSNHSEVALQDVSKEEAEQRLKRFLELMREADLKVMKNLSTKQ